MAVSSVRYLQSYTPYSMVDQFGELRVIVQVQFSLCLSLMEGDLFDTTSRSRPRLTSSYFFFTPDTVWPGEL